MTITSEHEGVSTFIEASIKYLGHMTERPFLYYYKPVPEGKPANNLVAPDTQAVRIRNARPLAKAGNLSVDQQGFDLLPFSTNLVPEDFGDEEKIRSIYYQEVEAKLKDLINPDKLVVFAHTIRTRDPSGRTPMLMAHVDQTPKALKERVHMHMGEEAPALLRGRYAIVNLWRPVTGPLEDHPLAMVDARTVDAEKDLVSADLFYEDRVGETCLVRHNPNHKWYYFPKMTTEEALLLKCGDSKEGVARFTPHAAFVDPSTPNNVLPRASIEARALVFWRD